MFHPKPHAELHAHLGASVDPPILWSIAHKQGIRLPTKDYWEFENMIVVKDNKKNKDLHDMHFNLYEWTELIQSSPEAVEESVKSVFGGGYRKCNITLHELRVNPMFRNRKGERDLDYIIKAAIWGMERAMMEYPQVKAGLIFIMGRLLSPEQNEIILNKAIKYKDQGVVGIDLADPTPKGFEMQDYKRLYEKAKAAGLGTTIHTGEQETLEEMHFVVDEIKPDRIGHGFMCYKDINLMKKIAAQNITLEICPTSNIKNSSIATVEEMKTIYRTLLDNNIKLTINTDGPEMYMTNIIKEENFLLENNIFTEPEIDQMRQNAFQATFIK